MEWSAVGRVVEWRGPAPFWFLALPQEVSDDVRELADAVSYGWGAVPVEAELGGPPFTTSLFPKDGRYLLPMKQAVRPAGLAAGDEVPVVLRIGLQAGDVG